MEAYNLVRKTRTLNQIAYYLSLRYVYESEFLTFIYGNAVTRKIVPAVISENNFRNNPSGMPGPVELIDYLDHENIVDLSYAVLRINNPRQRFSFVPSFESLYLRSTNLLNYDFPTPLMTIETDNKTLIINEAEESLVNKLFSTPRAYVSLLAFE